MSRLARTIQTCVMITSYWSSLSIIFRSLTEYLKNVTFQSELGYKFKFDGNEDVYGQYQIYLFREKRKLNPYTENMVQKIALWECKAAKFLYFYEHLGYTPMSTSNKVCYVGHGKERKETLRQCCTLCVKCQSYEYSDQYTQCQECNPNYTMPNENQTTCIEPSSKTFSYDDKFGILITIFLLIGLTIVIIADFMVVTFRNTHIIRASSWHLLLLLIIWDISTLFVNVHGFP